MFSFRAEYILCTRLTNGAAVQLTGKLLPSPGAGQEKELLVELGKGETDASSTEGVSGKVTEKGKIQLLGECDPEVSCFFFL